MSIRTRLVFLVLAVWLPAVIGFCLLAYSTYLRETEAAQDRVEQVAQDLKTVVERELDSRMVVAKTLAGLNSVRDSDFRRFHEEASKAVERTENWAFLLTEQDLVVSSLIPYEEMKPIHRPDGAEFTRSGPSIRFRPQGLLSKTPVVGVFAPEAQVTPPRYNVGVSFNPSFLQGAVERLKLPSGSVASIVDSNQILIARSRNPEQWVGKPATGAIIRRMQESRFGFAPSVTLDGIPSLAYLTPENRYGWYVVIALPTAALAQMADRLTLQAMAAAGLLLFLGLALALYATRGIARPLTQLRTSAQQLAHDTVPAPLATGLLEVDEVGGVLHEAGLEAKLATANLELRVKEAVQVAREAQAGLLDARKHEAIGRLTGGIAHDFNNLLQTISTGHQLLDHLLANEPPKRVLQSVQRATSKAADLVKQMLTFGRAQGLTPVFVDIVDLLLKSQELTRKGLGERVVLKEEIEGNLPPVFIDPNQLELALLNLVFNARDAMPQGGTITLTARLARASEGAEFAEGRFVCLEVADDGQGMDEETRSKAFDPYFTTKPVGTGSGLGLAQVLSLVRQSGGSVQLESQVGEGTRIRLYLPAPPSIIAGLPATETEIVSGPATKLNILMVEDDTLVSSVVVAALQAEGHQVLLRETADSARDLLRQGQAFDVLFTDVVMPGKMTGLDLVEWCRTNRPELPAVVATGYTSQEQSHGAVVLNKPYRVEVLLSSLNQAVAHHPTAGPSQ